MMIVKVVMTMLVVTMMVMGDWYWRCLAYVSDKEVVWCCLCLFGYGGNDDGSHRVVI